jgi:uncharacterized protein YndB with AHSA1/START domain
MITSEHAAPRELLFRAYTDPRLIAQWLGPRTMTMTVDRLEARDGGTWRFIHGDGGGRQYAFRGVYHGTPSPDGIVSTFEFEAVPGHVCLETVTFEERGGKTVLRQNIVYQSVEDRDRALRSGIEQGASESVRRLNELASRLAPVL